MKKPILMWFLGVALVTSACGTHDTDAGEETTADSLVSSLTLEDGSEIDFYRPAAGEVVVFAQLPDPEAEALELLETVESPVALFRALSGGLEPPPALLEAAVEAEAAAQAPVESEEEAYSPHPEPPLPDEPDGEGPQGVGQTSSALTAAQFADRYCPPGWGFMRCYLRRTGDLSVRKWTKDMRCRVNPYRGRVRLTLRRSGFVTVVQDVLENWLGYVRGYGSFQKRRCDVTRASGDGYHFSAYGR